MRERLVKTDAPFGARSLNAISNIMASRVWPRMLRSGTTPRSLCLQTHLGVSLLIRRCSPGFQIRTVSLEVFRPRFSLSHAIGTPSEGSFTDDKRETLSVWGSTAVRS